MIGLGNRSYDFEFMGIAVERLDISEERRDVLAQTSGKIWLCEFSELISWIANEVSLRIRQMWLIPTSRN
jgi:hypothetical protein